MPKCLHPVFKLCDPLRSCDVIPLLFITLALMKWIRLTWAWTMDTYYTWEKRAFSFYVCVSSSVSTRVHQTSLKLDCVILVSGTFLGWLTLWSTCTSEVYKESVLLVECSFGLCSQKYARHSSAFLPFILYNFLTFSQTKTLLFPATFIVNS